MKNIFKVSAALLAALVLLIPAPLSRAEGPGVVISEIMAANDVWKNGRHDDWVEIRNMSSSTADLSG